MENRPQIAIVDYQAGNLRSVQKALEKCGAAAIATSDPEAIRQADGVVFPGQGACDSSMRHIRELGLEGPIKESILSGKPFLGVCLGLQLLLEESDEGDEACLGILKGRVRRLPAGQKIPHMGWNQVDFKLDHPVLKGIPAGSYFYFVHSYYADPEDESVIAGTTDYGMNFCSAVAWDNVTAVQFHPEKSGDVGLIIYENFVKLVEQTKAAGVWR
ncbi:MAG: imidazole glycerol phosphate synthase subunit HisH [Chloroflexi bacterium]|nr:imidazole glycerol phosphate synthase subunit HisH [Chloroflexota bacterium]MDA1227582.1 imidazole glycerol phosphate synthase subunit HisH [Chloroflexota bacterium]